MADRDSILQLLRAASAHGDPVVLRAALPEPPTILAIFALEPADRDPLLARIMTVLETDEDHWFLIEAAAMHSRVHPERGAFLALIPFVPEELYQDTQRLAEQIVPASANAVRESLIA